MGLRLTENFHHRLIKSITLARCNSCNVEPRFVPDPEHKLRLMQFNFDVFYQMSLEIVFISSQRKKAMLTAIAQERVYIPKVDFRRVVGSW